MSGLFCPTRLISGVHLIATVPAFKTMAYDLHINGNTLWAKKKNHIKVLKSPVLLLGLLNLPCGFY